jgi:two-component system sensor histidine kinase VicK
MAVMHDITQQKRLEESQREFVANVSHELRTPLTNIKGYTETILDAGDEIDRETRDSFLGIVHSEADRMTTIVKDLLTLSQLDYGRMEMNLSPADLGRLAADSARAMKLEAQRQQITLRCLAPEHLPLVMGDQARLEQVIVNIISNAIKYNRPQGTVTVTGGAENGRVFLQVQDTGFGVSPEALPRVFDRFYRVDKARSRAKGGTGLGLSIVRDTVRRYGGWVTAAANSPEGSVFTVGFPRYEGEQEVEE